MGSVSEKICNAGQAAASYPGIFRVSAADPGQLVTGLAEVRYLVYDRVALP
jgi:hypothetical protein